MLTAKEVHAETLQYQKLNELNKSGLQAVISPVFAKAFEKKKFDAPAELYTVLEMIHHVLMEGEFEFSSSKENCFAPSMTPNTEAFSIPELKKHGFEVTDLGDGQVKISWAKGLGLTEET
ncbi:hypothetical protein DYBT9623_04432 [Dyadobacter sp. CECT 9623]|uniref:Uncharacterized protein n=1 Tax=Dyadobacter linearis TaxID=2823330 RepID=A0ABM8UW06_9BACT|nr:hypothetical protein [Dyadobacter sp. CECT 9623]CAG5072894.1 hypothetical protein DYBT9623_04432 [Dyadobacter sp. CECT 9623]